MTDVLGNALGDSLAWSSVSGWWLWRHVARPESGQDESAGGQSLAGDYAFPNEASGLSSSPQVALDISAVSASAGDADAAIVSSVARNVGGTSDYGPMPQQTPFRSQTEVCARTARGRSPVRLEDLQPIPSA